MGRGCEGASPITGLIRVVRVRGSSDDGGPGLCVGVGGTIFADGLLRCFEERVGFLGGEGYFGVELNFYVEIVGFRCREG